MAGPTGRSTGPAGGAQAPCTRLSRGTEQFANTAQGVPSSMCCLGARHEAVPAGWARAGAPTGGLPSWYVHFTHPDRTPFTCSVLWTHHVLLVSKFVPTTKHVLAAAAACWTQSGRHSLLLQLLCLMLLGHCLPAATAAAAVFVAKHSCILMQSKQVTIACNC